MYDDYETTGEPVFNKVNYRDAAVSYKVEQFESNNYVIYLNKIKEEILTRFFDDWSSLFKKFKIQIKPTYVFHNSLTEETQNIYRDTKPEVILTRDNFENYIDDLTNQMSGLIEDMELKDSGWIFEKISGCEINVYDIADIRASSYIPGKY